MTVLFSENYYKYEIEAVMKLFFPAENFTFIEEAASADINPDEDFIIVRRKKCKRYDYLYIYVKYQGNIRRRASKIDPDTDDYDYKCEQKLCRMLFLCLRELTGIYPAWGSLTGIRPVKLINRMLSEGMSREDITGRLKNDFFVSDEKLSLAWKTAEVQEKFLKDIDESRFSLYVSIPFCPTRCSYCSFVSHSMKSAVKLIPQYIEKVCEELRLTGEIAKNLGLTLDTIYFGGGTPTSLEAEQLRQLMRAVEDNFDLSSLREYNVEAGRADTITEEKLRVIKEMGADRICVNPQTLNNDVLRAIGRNHTAEDFISAFNLARKIGFNLINTDLIAGLPTDTTESFRRTIDGIISLSPENVTVHTLSLKRSAGLYREDTGVLKNPVSEMVSYGARQLAEHGYHPYYLYRQKNTVGNLENVGYSKPDTESLYNIYIMEEIQTILAVGAAASTKIVRGGRPERIFNYKFPYEYISRFEEIKKRKMSIYNYFT